MFFFPKGSFIGLKGFRNRMVRGPREVGVEFQGSPLTPLDCHKHPAAAVVVYIHHITPREKSDVQLLIVIFLCVLLRVIKESS